MALTKFTTDVENIQALSDTPNETEGLTADQLKKKFDDAAIDIKSYINDTLTDEIDTEITAINTEIADSDWISLGYGSGFEASAFGYAPAYRKIGNMVYLRGVSTKSTGNIANADTPIGTLPANYRPTTVCYFTCRSNAGYTITIQINPDGTSSIGIGGYSSGTYISVDGIVFSID